MARDVDVSVGSETSAAAAGFAELKNYAAKARHDLQHEFAQAIAFTGIVAGIEGVIEKAHEVHHQSERFGVDAQFLQIMANAAKEDGIQLNSVARAMNLLEINTQKGRDGSEKIINAFDVLGIKVDDVRKLRPEELMLRIADGVKNASDRTAAYAAVATLLGARMGTDLIPVLEKGSEAILQIGIDMGVMSDETIKKLDEVHKQIEKFKQQLTVGLGGSVAWLITQFQEFVDTVTEMIGTFVKGSTAAFASLDKAIHLDFAGAKKDWKDFLDYVSELQDSHGREAQIKAQQAATPHAPSAEGTGHVGLEASEANPGDVGTGARSGTAKSGGGGQSNLESLKERAAKLQEDSLHRQESLEGKLNSLQRERTQIQNDLVAKAVASTQTEEDYYKATIAIAEKDKEIRETKAEIAKQAAEYASAQAKAREEAEKAAEAENRRIQILNLELSGHGDLVDELRQGWEFEDKINDLAQQISDAYRSGDDALGDQLTKLQEQVKLEEKLVATKQRQKDLQKAQVDSFVTSRGLLSGSAGAGAGGFGGLTSATFTDPRIVALLNAGFNIDEHSITAATNSRTGEIDMDKLEKEMIAATQRGTKDIGFIQRAKDNAANAALGASQSGRENIALAGQRNTIQQIIAEIAQYGTFGGGNGLFEQMLEQLILFNSRPPGDH